MSPATTTPTATSPSGAVNYGAQITQASLGEYSGGTFVPYCRQWTTLDPSQPDQNQGFSVVVAFTGAHAHDYWFPTDPESAQQTTLVSTTTMVKIAYFFVTPRFPVGGSYTTDSVEFRNATVSTSVRLYFGAGPLTFTDKTCTF